MKHEELLDRRSEPQSRLAHLLLEGRTAVGLTQTAAAQKIGVTSTYLGRLEHGVYSNPSARILSAAAEVYRISQADLFAAAGYTLPSELPTFPGYLHATCKGWPDAAIQELVDFYEFIRERCERK
jgi:transcriptional regulator with XRE-family HTH domain